VRKNLNAPELSFVTGVMGVGGAKPNEHVAAFREATEAPAKLPEFQGNVVAVATAPFWSEELGAIADKHEQVRQMAYELQDEEQEVRQRRWVDERGQQRERVKQFGAKLISPEEETL
jgi:hypothetical protein